MLTTILPASSSAWADAVTAAPSHGVAITTRSVLAAAWLSPADSSRLRSGQRPRISSTTPAARTSERDPSTTS